MICFDNIFSLNENNEFVDDRKNYTTSLVSHGHFDHIPSRFLGKEIICSDVTRKLIELRRNAKIIPSENSNFEMLDSGHTLGSKMFYLRDKEILFTGDFNTVDKYCGFAKPKKCKTLIIESTFGKEKYIFPKYESVVKEFIDYIKERKSCINVYSFGKAQEICHLLDKHKIHFSIENQSISRIHDALGLEYKYEGDKAEVVLSNSELHGFKRVGLTGWALDNHYKYMRGLDEVFPLSDHADFPSIIQFIKKCNPEKIYTYHGFCLELAQTLRKADFDAQPLLQKQKVLAQY